MARIPQFVLVCLCVLVADARARAGFAADQVAPHDLLAVTLHDFVAPGAVELRVRVNPDGQISLPVIGTVKVAGATAAEAATAVSEAYKACPFPSLVNAKIEFVESGDAVTLKSAPVARGELIQVRMWSVARSPNPNQETKLELRVSDKGRVTLPHVGDVDVDGKTEAEVESAVAALFRERGLVANLFISVLRLEVAT